MVNDDRSRKSDDNEPEVQETIGTKLYSYNE